MKLRWTDKEFRKKFLENEDAFPHTHFHIIVRREATDRAIKELENIAVVIVEKDGAVHLQSVPLFHGEVAVFRYRIREWRMRHGFERGDVLLTEGFFYSDELPLTASFDEFKRCIGNVWEV